MSQTISLSAEWGLAMQDYRVFSCDVTVMWIPYGWPFWCAVEWRLSMLHDAHAKCSPNL